MRACRAPDAPGDTSRPRDHHHTILSRVAPCVSASKRPSWPPGRAPHAVAHRHFHLTTSHSTTGRQTLTRGEKSGLAARRSRHAWLAASHIFGKSINSQACTTVAMPYRRRGSAATEPRQRSDRPQVPLRSDPASAAAARRRAGAAGASGQPIKLRRSAQSKTPDQVTFTLVTPLKGRGGRRFWSGVLSYARQPTLLSRQGITESPVVTLAPLQGVGVCRKLESIGTDRCVNGFAADMCARLGIRRRADKPPLHSRNGTSFDTLSATRMMYF